MVFVLLVPSLFGVVTVGTIVDVVVAVVLLIVVPSVVDIYGVVVAVVS